MGCLRISYSENESPLRVSRDEEKMSVKWQVWTAKNTPNQHKECEEQALGGSDCPTCPRSSSDPAFGHSSDDWVDVGVAVNAIFAAGIEIGTHPSQKPRYFGPNDFKNASRVGKTLGSRLSIAGALVSVGQAAYNPTGGNITDAVFGVIGAIPGYGTAIGGIYFGIDLLTLGITGKDISGHIDSYIWMPNPSGMGFIPVTKIPSK